MKTPAIDELRKHTLNMPPQSMLRRVYDECEAIKRENRLLCATIDNQLNATTGGTKQRTHLNGEELL